MRMLAAGVLLLCACGPSPEGAGDEAADAVVAERASDASAVAPGGEGSSEGVVAEPGSTGQTAGPPRHVLLVILEAARADHVGAYGYERPTTPRLDALAKAGVVYERAYAASSVVSQSLSALWTGRLPSSGGATGLSEAQPHESLPSLPRLFRAAGYRTGFVSNHQALWYRGFTRGFDELEVDSVAGRWPAPEVRVRALDIVDGWLAADARDGRAAAAPGGQGLRAGPSTPASLLVVDFADAREPHLPIPAARALMDAPVPEQTLSLEAVRAGAGQLPPDLADTPMFRDLVARYDAELAMVDDQLGMLVDGLAARGLLDDTLLIVTSSHGLEFLEHGYVGSGWSLHEEVLRVPLVLHAPGRLAPARVAEPVSHVDLLPSLSELYGLAAREQRFDGRALLEAGAGLLPRRPDGDVLAELVIPELSVLRALIRGKHKLVQSVAGFAPGERLELSRAYSARVAAMQDGELERPDVWGAPSRTQLFDLGADPGERVDLSAGTADAVDVALVQRLAEVLARYAGFCRDNAPAARAAARAQQLSAEAQTLQQLGYL